MDETTPSVPSPLRFIGKICSWTLAGSIGACLIIAGLRSSGLTEVAVTALDAEAEPRDHGLPFVKKKDALPDYQVLVVLHEGRRINLGAKPNTSATSRLVWKLSDPVSSTDIATIRLQDQDKVVSDVLAEVHYSDSPVESGNYRFEFRTERSFNVGLQSFFGTPIGKAISAAIVIALLIVILSVVRI